MPSPWIAVAIFAIIGIALALPDAPHRAGSGARLLGPGPDGGNTWHGLDMVAGLIPVRRGFALDWTAAPFLRDSGILEPP
jgi:hypothetical protein